MQAVREGRGAEEENLKKLKKVLDKLKLMC